MRPLCLVLLVWGFWAPQAASADDAQLQKSRALVKQFGAELKATLLGAMETGGPIEAMTVCRDADPNIAAHLSRQAGAKISRTSRRFRNPLNAPEPWQRAVLTELFEPTAQETGHRIEYYARRGTDVRYMEVIRLEPVCAVCHGIELSEPVQGFMSDNYPYDLARGYKPGDVRGAFSVVWPAQGQGQASDGP